MTTVVIPVYDHVTQLDFTAPHQFLTMIPDIEVVVASIGAKPVISHGLSFDRLADLDKIDRCDVICVPGGLGCIDAIEDKRFLDAVRRLAGTAAYVTSVCSGSMILGAAGLLKGKRAASHWAWLDLLPSFGASPEKARVVRDGNVITGGGVTAGADFALTLISELRGEDAAQCVQLALEYAPAPPFDAGDADTAPTHVRYAVIDQMSKLMGDTRRRVESFGKQVA
ncbi:DJ-1/PfpI family protein [Bradyrhizobium liaoningense]|uniref:DJ-1/PfpI family protein n=1 Tax=Bradyrhizobium liaoningense TaxID=43992 RepID=UPI001BA4D259|nr:DJ-1/PfpI family protein [Bradyrhizobium liaoningense]MBR1167488.1 DJ-1/PfpI family protein [Bradyrhizobium liaoningense]